MKKLILSAIILLQAIYLSTASSVNTSKRNGFQETRDYYINRGDTLKVKALQFIEDNVDIHYSFTHHWQDTLKNSYPFNEIDYVDYNTSKIVLNDKIKKYKLSPVYNKISDIEFLTKERLIKIIDTGFENWSKPWNSKLSFNDFCDYLLPYRVQNEPIEDWLDIYKKRFSNLSQNSTSEICNSVNNDLKKWFYCSFSYEDRTSVRYYLSPQQLLFRKQGTCQDMCNLSVYAMRALGLATSIDFTPAWATSSYNHWWCTFIDESNYHRPFEGVTGSSSDFVIYREPGKVFRFTYRKQTNALASQISSEDIPQGHLQYTNIIDVTNEYWRTANIECNLKIAPLNNISYISVFNSLTWRPIDWGKVDNKIAKFNNLSVGSIYLPMNFDKNKLIPAGNPILLKADKQIKVFEPNHNKLINITIPESSKYLIYRIGKKYKFFYWDKKWVEVEIQIANEKKLLTFKNIPSNTIYLLVPEYSEKKERIFTLNENNEIERW